MFEEILKRIDRLGKAIEYQTKLLESLTDLVESKTEDNQQIQQAVKAQIGQFNQMFAGHPAVKENPEIAKMVDSMMLAFGDRS